MAEPENRRQGMDQRTRWANSDCRDTPKVGPDQSAIPRCTQIGAKRALERRRAPHVAPVERHGVPAFDGRMSEHQGK